jgi:hypothetical protein
MPSIGKNHSRLLVLFSTLLLSFIILSLLLKSTDNPVGNNLGTTTTTTPPETKITLTTTTITTTTTTTTTTTLHYCDLNPGSRECFIELAVNEDNPDICFKANYEGTKQLCITRYAMLNNDLSVCEELEGEQAITCKWSVIDELAYEQDIDPRMCSILPDTGTYRDICFLNIARYLILTHETN